MKYVDIEYRVDEHVARVTANRPRYRNAQSRRMLEELDVAFGRAVDDANVRVIVLNAAGDHFSGGHDLGSPDELADRKERPLGAGLRGRYRALARTLCEQDAALARLAETDACGGSGLLHLRRLDGRVGDGHHLRGRRCDVSASEFPVLFDSVGRASAPRQRTAVREPFHRCEGSARARIGQSGRCPRRIAGRNTRLRAPCCGQRSVSVADDQARGQSDAGSAGICRTHFVGARVAHPVVGR